MEELNPPLRNTAEYQRGLRTNRKSGKIVLPCKPKFPRKGKSFFQARFAADSIFGQVISWRPI